VVDFILHNTSLYWLTNTGGSSIRFCYEDARAHQETEVFADDLRGFYAPLA
jgi:hypothetical protein